MKYTLENSGLRMEAEFSENNVKEIFLPLLERLTAIQRQKGRRALALMAAPPGSGKSTLAAFLQHLSRATPGLCPMTALGMDGFHRTHADLAAHTVLRDGETIPMTRIKGAPETFDLKGLTAAVARVAAGEDCGWPRYDRLLHDPVQDAQRVSGDLVLIEGNYLLLDEDGWRDLRNYADYTIAIQADPDQLRDRLIPRHVESGKSPEDARRMVEKSDMANARLCLERTLPADLRLWLCPDGSFRLM